MIKKQKKQNGITLIALVVTIVVLLILAGVSISMLTGENGIIKQAQDAKENSSQAKVEETVKLAINSLMAENKGNKTKITPEMIANQINKDENRTDVKAEGNTFPTNIIFEEEGRKVEVDANLAIVGTSGGDAEISESEKYYGDATVEPSSSDLFIFTINEDTTAKIASTTGVKVANTEEKTATIAINGKYVKFNEYYQIIYNDAEIKELVIPYEYEYEGEIYKVNKIKNNGFENLQGVENIVMPNTITNIGDYAFDKCPRLVSIEIPKSVTSIGDYAFKGCAGLTSIKVNENNAVYDSRDNCNALIETATNTLIKGSKNTIIPNNVTSIEEYAFYKCENLTSIEISESVTSIGSSAFERCTGLTSITIPENVTSIGINAFYWCTDLTNIEIPASVTSIGSSAFDGCTRLTSIKVDGNNTVYDSRDNCNALIETTTNTLIKGSNNTIIPRDITSIKSAAFRGCIGLTSVTIPEGVTSIGEYAFYNCTGLTSITIPEKVTKIGKYAFSECNNLSEVYFEQTTAPTFEYGCFKKYSELKTIFYFKNSTVAGKFTTSYYNSSNGEKSTNYDW